MMTNIQGHKILVIDDDPSQLLLLRHIFSQAKAETYTAENGLEGLRQFYACQPNLVIVDLIMPEMNGWEVCRLIRQLSDVPVIMLTAQSRDDYVIEGLDSGADDYLTKPFNDKILLARVRAVLRRKIPKFQAETPPIYCDNRLTIDLNKRQVLICGQPIKLTTREYRLLDCLVRNANQILTFQQILEKVWGWEFRNQIDYVHVHISRLRGKLEENPRHPKYLRTEYGVGYSFEKQDTR